MKPIKVPALLMGLTIFFLLVFQVYWLTRLYREEWKNLRRELDVSLRESLYRIQSGKLKGGINVIRQNAQAPAASNDVSAVEAMNFLKAKDGKDSIVIRRNDTAHKTNVVIAMNGNIKDTALLNRLQFFTGGAGGDSITLKELQRVYESDLEKSHIHLPFTLHKRQFDSRRRPDENDSILQTRYALVGFVKPYGFQARFESPFWYLLNKIKLPIIYSLLLLAITLISFIVLYKSLLAQRKLAGIKNEFISNITHELKTPIATVQVAIEALQNFNALQNPERTREYLSISSIEMQRLSLLVDKVLKLSMFENQVIELQKETFDLQQLAAEVATTLKLQLDKVSAHFELRTEGPDFTLTADRMHIMSVLYNLVDNALKYSPAQPHITMLLKDMGDMVAFSVTDRGMGIPAAYTNRIFDKFFRVPTNNRHNIKGHGLGLSYVYHIVELHGGTVKVQSRENEGSTFTVVLPK
jgi:two-component system phosphate regulon sensor histidine kinase PhoR